MHSSGSWSADSACLPNYGDARALTCERYMRYTECPAFVENPALGGYNRWKSPPTPLWGFPWLQGYWSQTNWRNNPVITSRYCTVQLSRHCPIVMSLSNCHVTVQWSCYGPVITLWSNEQPHPDNSALCTQSISYWSQSFSNVIKIPGLYFHE